MGPYLDTNHGGTGASQWLIDAKEGSFESVHK